jgi:putative flippase GtrA
MATLNFLRQKRNHPYITRKNRHASFLKYFLIASFCSILDLGTLYILTENYNVFYLVSAIVSFGFSQSFNFAFNKILNFNFQFKTNLLQQVITFLSINLVGLFVSLVIFTCLVEIFNIWYLISRVISMLSVVNLNYYLHKRITFMER